MSRKSFYALTAALAVIALAWLYFSKKPSKTGEVSPALGEYISAYTSGYISNRSAIKILLANALPDSGAIMKPDKELFTFEPSISGTTSWIDNRTIEFKPAKNLPSGQHYRALFRLAEIMQVPEDIEEFEFEFSVIKQSISVAVDGMRTIDNKQMIWQKVIGTVAMADYVASEDAEKTVAARQDGKNLKSFWEHLEDNRHRFSIDSIQRKDAPGEVVISWDGNPVSVNEEGKIPFTIPGLNEFSVMDARVIQTPEQYIQILFSDPLTGKQNLDGLISLVIPDNANPVPIKITIDNNELRAYPSSRQIGMLTLSVETGVQNILGFKLIKSFRRELSFEEIKPQIKFTGNGVILPSSNGLVLPFEAVNVRAVDIKAVRIFENNIAQFFQVNTLSGNYELHRVGRTVLKKTIALNAQNELDYQSWKTYYLDLTGLIKTDPGAVYKIAMNFKKEYTTFHCEGEEKKELNLTQINQGSGDDEDNRDDYSENYYYYDDYDYYDYNYEGYDYEDRYNPCKQAYYGRNKEISRNIIASDLGIIAKRGNNGEVLVAVSDIRNVKPTGGVSVELLNYQQQVIAARTTDNDGFTKFEPEGKPFLLVARKGDQRGYLKMDVGSSPSMEKEEYGGPVTRFT
ncbi:MAG: hypothetical protein HYY40_05235 [Bacteroidetes bacterium]|nr:hypothetical protein [Bacteroidota bacterium]